MNYKNSFIQIIHRSDGTYIKVFPAKQDGKLLAFEEVSAYFNDNKIINYDIKAVYDLLLNATEPTEVLLMKETILPINEYLKLCISPDRMIVAGKFYPPSSKGKFLDKQDIMDVLLQAKIKYGILEKQIDVYLKGRQFCTSVILAKGLMVTQGKAAEIKYRFNVEQDVKPKINEDGSVDFHQIDNINKISEGALLATLTPANLGKPGRDVFENEIPPFKVVRKVLKHGKNIHLSEDGLKMYSDVSGHVSLMEETVFVSNTYEVPADVGTSTGDIDYDGDVHVGGNVITGFSIKASGDVIVEGVVEGASIFAEGQIVLKRGIQGMSRGTLQAGGDITTKFIESSEVISGGIISTDAIMHSVVSAKKDILVQGKRGLITGGEIKSGGNIVAKTVGSTMGTATILSVGVDPEILEKLRQLEKKLSDLKSEIEKKGQIINLLRKKLENGEKLSQEKLQTYKSTKEKSILLEAHFREILEQYTVLKEEMVRNVDGRIRVENIAYPGVKIIISNTIYYVKKEIHYSQFLKERAEIKVTGL